MLFVEEKKGTKGNERVKAMRALLRTEYPRGTTTL